MVDVTLTPQRVGAAGAVPTRTGSLSTSNTYVVRNDGKTLLAFLKAGASDCIVTVKTPATVGGLAVAERTLTTVVATTGEVIAGPFAPGIYNDSSGDLKFTLDNITGLDVAVIQL